MPAELEGFVVSESKPVRWLPDREQKLPTWPVPRVWDAMKRGALGACPACGGSRLFRSFLKVEPVCAKCTAPLGQARADDAPPYFTIVVVGHVVVPAMLFVEKTWTPDLWIHTAIWVPLSMAMVIGLLRPIKGMTVGVLTAMGMITPDGPG